MDNFHNFLRTRRSVRRFKPDPVPAPVIERILETSTFAPSAHNLQPWRFAVVANKSARTRLGKALTDKMRADMTVEGAQQAVIDKRVTISLRRIDEAPEIILLCRDVNAVREEEPEEHIMAVQSTALAGLQLMLAAHAEGLGTNWICWPLYAHEATQNALSLPDTWEPQGMFFLGYSDEKLNEKNLKPLKEVVLKI